VKPRRGGERRAGHRGVGRSKDCQADVRAEFSGSPAREYKASQLSNEQAGQWVRGDPEYKPGPPSPQPRAQGWGARLGSLKG
jgi:hypothetical protein